MRAVATEIYESARDVLKITFLTPVVEGRPHPTTWPKGIVEVAWAAALLFTLLTLAIVTAVPLRLYDVLALSPTASSTLPSLSVPLLTTSLIISFAMIATAALHAPWWLRLTLLALSGLATALFSASTLLNRGSMLIMLAGFVSLVVFTFARARRSYVWWEFPVVLSLLIVTLLLPLTVPSSVTWGIDTRPMSIEATLSSLQPLIVPAAMVAGFAPTQIVVTGAQSIANRPVSRSLFWVVFGLSLTALVAAVAAAVANGDAPTLDGIATSGVALALTAAVIGLLLWRAKATRPPAPAEYPEPWSNWLYPVATAIMFLQVLVVPLLLARAITQAIGSGEAAATTEALWWAIFDNHPGVVWRGLIGIVTVIGAWRLSSRGRLTEAIVLAGFGIGTVLTLLSGLPSLEVLRQRSAFDMGLVAATVAVAAGSVHLARRRFDRGRAVGVLTVVLLALMYPYRDALSDPVSAALAVAPTALLVFGLGWRLLTEAQVTYHSSKRYPQSTRILLFLANSLLAATGIAFITLSRGLGGPADATSWGILGDQVLGEPLFITGLVAGLWLVLRPHTSADASDQLTDERYDPAEAAVMDAALEGSGNPNPARPNTTKS